MIERNNPCRHLKVEHHESGVKQHFISALAAAVGQGEEHTKKLFNL